MKSKFKIKVRRESCREKRRGGTVAEISKRNAVISIHGESGFTASSRRHYNHGDCNTFNRGF